MILPIGHQEREVRRLPWVTFAIMALCLLTFLFTDTSSLEEPLDVVDHLEEAAQYWRRHAYLEAHPKIREYVSYDVAPNQRRQYLATLPELSRHLRPKTREGLAAQQAELDRLTDLALGLRRESDPEADPYRRFGLVPARLRAHAFLTHMFMHAGWMHLLGNLFILLLAGPPIEDRWGRAIFGVFYGLAGLFAAVFYLGFVGDSTIPMVGASGAIAGVLGAFFVRLWRTKIRFAYFFLFALRPIWGTFEAPAWAMLPLWFGNEVVQGMLWQSLGTAGGIAYWAHVGGFLFGVGAASVVRISRVEERWIAPAVDAQLTRFRANPVLEEALAARERGELGEALECLAAEWEREPDEEIALAFWDAALACAQPERAAPAMLSVVREAAQRRELELALRHWSELSDHVPSALLDPGTLLGFVPPLLAENQKDRAALALRQAVHPDNASLSVGQALRVVTLARELHPPSALRAARRALESPDLHEAKRERLVALIAELGAEGVVEEAASPERAELAPEERSRVWDEDGVIGISRFGRAKLLEAVPKGLEDGMLRLVVEDQREAGVALSKIQAVSVAILGDLGPKPVLVIDLLANWNEPAAEALRGVRLRSDRFDARRLLGVEGDPRRAFAGFVSRLLEGSRGVPLPNAKRACGEPFARYDTLDEYQKSVLEVAE